MKKHCRTCTCTSEPKTFTIYPANGTLYGVCDTCRTPRWEVEHDTEYDGYAPRRSLHCACCEHAHDLPPGSHDEACLANPRDCGLIDAGRAPEAGAGR